MTPPTVTEIEWAPILSDIEAAEKFRRGHGAGYDREVAMLTAAFARHRQAALREGIRIGLEAAADILKEWACGYGHSEKVFANGNLRLAASTIRALDPDTLLPMASEEGPKTVAPKST